MGSNRNSFGFQHSRLFRKLKVSFKKYCKTNVFTGYDIRDVVQSRANCIYTMSGEG